MIKVLILTPIWKRPQVTEIFCLGLSRLISYRGDLKIEPLLIVSPDEDKTDNMKIIRKFGFKTVKAPNGEGVGNKKNIGLQAAMNKRWDYLLELNSDDVIYSSLLDIFYPWWKKKAPFIGIQNFGIIDGINKKAKHKHKSSCLFGIGRSYSKAAIRKAAFCTDVEGKVKYIGEDLIIKPGEVKSLHIDLANKMEKKGVLEKIGQPKYELWRPELNRGLDNESERRFNMVGITPTILRTQKPLAIDIKTDVNIWPYKEMSGNDYSFQQLISGLSVAEQEKIKAL